MPLLRDKLSDLLNARRKIEVKQLKSIQNIEKVTKAMKTVKKELADQKV